MSGAHALSRHAAVEPGSVVIRGSRLVMVVPTAICGACGAGLWIALWNLVVHHDSQTAGYPWPAKVLVWLMVLAFALGLTFATVVCAIGVVASETPTVLSPRRLAGPPGTILATDMHTIRYLAGRATTWSGGPDPRARFGRSRLSSRVDVQAGHASYSFVVGSRQWPRVARILDGWLAARPDAADDATRVFIAQAASARPRTSRWGWVIGWLICSAAIAAATLVGVAHLPFGGRLTPGETMRTVVGSLFPGALVLAFVAPFIGLVAQLSHVIAVRDGWAPFVPRPGGDYHWTVSGRFSLLRLEPGERRGAVGLVARWVGLLLYGVAPPALLVLIGWQLLRIF